MSASKIPSLKSGKQVNTAKVTPGPVSYPPTSYSVFQKYDRRESAARFARSERSGSMGSVRLEQQSTAMATIEQKRPKASRGSSYQSFRRPPPSIRMPSNMSARRSEHVAVAFVSINDEESQAIANPLAELLDTIGDYLEGPDSEEGAGRVIIRELIDVDRLMQLHTTDAERGKKERVAAAKRKRGRRLIGTRKQPERPVFGTPLRTIYDYAAVWMLIGKFPCKVPIVLIATVEQLYNRGMNDEKLFEPDPPIFSNKIIEMMDAFSNGHNYGDETDSPVNTASVADMCHLFRYFLDSLPAPPLEQIAFRALSDICVIPSTLERRERERNGGTICTQHMLDNEEFRIVIAKLILRLLPESHFSALTYLLAFLSQLPSCSAADLTVEKLSVMFGPSICGPRDPLSYLETEQTFPDDDDFKMDLHQLEDISVAYVESLAIDTLHWLLTYWDYIADGLLLEDYRADISSFQNMVAGVVEQEYASELFGEDLGENIFSGTKHEADDPQSQAQNLERTAPVIPRRLCEDEEGMLVDEHEPEGLYDDDGEDDQGDQAAGPMGSTSPLMLKEDASQQLQKGLGLFVPPRIAMEADDEHLRTAATRAKVHTPTIESPAFYVPESRVVLDEVTPQVTHPDGQMPPMHWDQMVQQAHINPFDPLRKPSIPPPYKSISQEVSPLTPLADIPDARSPQWHINQSLHEIIQAKENLISQQASHIAGLEIRQRNLEAETRAAKQRAEELEKEAAMAVAGYKALRDHLQKALGGSPIV